MRVFNPETASQQSKEKPPVTSESMQENEKDFLEDPRGSWQLGGAGDLRQWVLNSVPGFQELAKKSQEQSGQPCTLEQLIEQRIQERQKQFPNRGKYDWDSWIQVSEKLYLSLSVETVNASKSKNNLVATFALLKAESQQEAFRRNATLVVSACMGHDKERQQWYCQSIVKKAKQMDWVLSGNTSPTKSIQGFGASEHDRMEQFEALESQEYDPNSEGYPICAEQYAYRSQQHNRLSGMEESKGLCLRVGQGRIVQRRQSLIGSWGIDYIEHSNGLVEFSAMPVVILNKHSRWEYEQAMPTQPEWIPADWMGVENHISWDGNFFNGSILGTIRNRALQLSILNAGGCWIQEEDTPNARRLVLMNLKENEQLRVIAQQKRLKSALKEQSPNEKSTMHQEPKKTTKGVRL